MKRKNLVLLTSFLLTQTAPALAMNAYDVERFERDKRTEPSRRKLQEMEYNERLEPSRKKLQGIEQNERIEASRQKLQELEMTEWGIKLFGEDYYSKALDLEKTGNFSHAATCLYQAADRSKNMGHEHLAEFYASQGRRIIHSYEETQALQELDRGVQLLGMDYFSINYDKALDLEKRGDFAQATACLYHAADKCKNMGHERLAEFYSSQGRRIILSSELYYSAATSRTQFQQSSPNSSKYNVESDFKGFIKKLRINDKILIKNNSNDEIALTLKCENKNNTGTFKRKICIVEPYYEDSIPLNNLVLSEVTFTNGNVKKYLNPKFRADGKLQITIENDQDKHFLHQYHRFDFFKPIKFTEHQLLGPWSQEEKNFRKDFNGSCDFTDYMMRDGYQSSLEAVAEQRKNLYAKNNIASLLQNNPGLLDSGINKIPLITHKIWLTSDDNPKDPSSNYIKWLENSIEHNKTSEGWSHYFWINNKKSLSKLPLLRALENHDNIKIRELDETSSFITGNLYKQAIKDKRYGKASDIVRLELLRKHGGFYTDTDYELFQSLKPYSKAYDMVIGLEPMSVYLCNAFMGVKKEHPVVTKALQMIKRNFSPDAPNYIKGCTDDAFATIIQTGPGLMTAAFALAGGGKDNVDVVLPPQIICPAITKEYPQKQVPKPGDRVPAEAIGVHYWEGAWVPGSKFDAK